MKHFYPSITVAMVFISLFFLITVAMVFISLFSLIWSCYRFICKFKTVWSFTFLFSIFNTEPKSFPQYPIHLTHFKLVFFSLIAAILPWFSIFYCKLEFNKTGWLFFSLGMLVSISFLILLQELFLFILDSLSVPIFIKLYFVNSFLSLLSL